MLKLRIRVNDEVTPKEAFMAFLESLPYAFDHLGTAIHEGRNVLRSIDAEDCGIGGLEGVVVKRYRGLIGLQKLVYSFLGKHKGRCAYDNTEEMRRRGFDAARQLALVEVWRHGLFQYSFYVAERVEGERLTKLIRGLNERGNTEEVARLISQYATFVKTLHERGVLFNDLNGGNVICRPAAGGQWHFSLVDTDRATLFDANRQLDLKTARKDLILMNPELGTNEMFQEEYLRQRGLYSKETAAKLKKAQFDRYARKQKWYGRLLKAYRQMGRKLRGKK